MAARILTRYIVLVDSFAAQAPSTGLRMQSNHGLRKDCEKLDPEDGKSSLSREDGINDSNSKVPDLPCIGAPPPSAKDVVEIQERGRRQSVISDDSHRTVSDDSQTPPYREPSRAQSSVRSAKRELVKVPRNRRRGWLARFALVPEVTNPYDYPQGLKWLIVLTAAGAGAVAPMGSSIILPALNDITRTYKSTATVVNMSIAFYLLSMSIFPLWWSSFSETLGRRTIYLSSFALFVIFNAASAVSPNIAMYIVMRILSGGAAASVQAVGAGTVADVFEVRERGKAMGVFYLGPLMGPLLSPIIGGAMAQTLGWRSIHWFLTVFGGCVLLFVLFALPETLKERKSIIAEAAEETVEEAAGTEGGDAEKGIRPALTRTSTRQSVKVRSRKYIVLLRRAFVDPLRIVLYLQFPAIALVVAYSSVTFASLYMLNISVQDSFSARPYNYSTIIIGLCYLPNSLGYFLTSVFGGRWIDKIMHREATRAVERGERQRDEKGRLPYRPEDRMKENAWVGCTVFPLAILVYGWTVNYGVNASVPLIANFFFGIGSMLIFSMFTTMLTEFMPRKASNGVALNNFVRNIFSCVGCIVAEPIIAAIGNGWLFTILALVSMISGYVAIWVMKRWGNHWRINMDKNIEKAMGE